MTETNNNSSKFGLDPVPVPISSILPPYLHKVFPFDNFTPMQSQSLQTWNTDDNLLISAPTGSGKTVCFELAILRLLHTATINNSNNRLGPCGLNGGKIIYLSPTKSLCNERGNDWKTKFTHLGLRVQVIIGDSPSDDSSQQQQLTEMEKFNILLNSDIIITTAEKLDSLIRNEQQQQMNILSKVILLLLDEVHHVGDSRGAIFELLITRTLTVCDEAKQLNCIHEYPISSLRVIAVSATIGNVYDVANWLKVSHQNVLCFDHSYRPVPLDYVVIPYSACSPWMINKVLEKNILSVIKQYSTGKPSIIFCTSRRQTSAAAESLVKKLNDNEQQKRSKNIKKEEEEELNELMCNLNKEQRGKLYKSIEHCNDTFLKKLLSNGIAIHNADMSEESRTLVETLFKQCLILCLFSTTTLAQGVNLPARLVVIYGTSIYEHGLLKEYDINQLLQMCGRAGRHGLDGKGVAVIMTNRDNYHLYVNLKSVEKNIESQLLGKIEECINTEIARNQLTNIPAVISFLSNTFYWIRAKTLFSSSSQSPINNAKLQHSNEGQLNSNNVEHNNDGLIIYPDRLVQIGTQCINELIRTNLVTFENDGFNIHCTNLGSIMAKYSLSYKSIRTIASELCNAKTPSKVMELISGIDELTEGIYLRRNEKKRLNELNELIRVPIQGRIKTVQEKINVLLQSGIDLKRTWITSDYALRNESNRLHKCATRVCQAILDLIFCQESDLNDNSRIVMNYSCVLSILQICRSLISKCGRDIVSILSDKCKISEHISRILLKNGVKNVNKICELTRDDIADKLRSSSSNILINKILNNSKKFPRFNIKALILRDNGGNGRIITLDIRISVFCNAGMTKMKKRLGNGFIIISNDNDLILHINRLNLLDGIYNNICQVPVDDNGRGSKWINVYVGCDSVLGLDLHHQFMEGGRPTGNKLLYGDCNEIIKSEGSVFGGLGLQQYDNRVLGISGFDSIGEANEDNDGKSELKLGVGGGRITKKKRDNISIGGGIGLMMNLPEAEHIKNQQLKTHDVEEEQLGKENNNNNKSNGNEVNNIRKYDELESTDGSDVDGIVDCN